MSSLTTYASSFSANDNGIKLQKRKSKRHLSEQNNSLFYDNDDNNETNSTTKNYSMTHSPKLNQQQLEILKEADKLTMEEFRNNDIATKYPAPYEKSNTHEYNNEIYNSILQQTQQPKKIITTASNYIPLQGQTLLSKGGDFNNFYEVPKSILNTQQQQFLQNNSIEPLVQQNSKNDIDEKLDYIIHLLEESKNEKTDYIMEEFCLYSFLGIFVIFVVDSFNKSNGRYIR